MFKRKLERVLLSHYFYSVKTLWRLWLLMGIYGKWFYCNNIINFTRLYVLINNVLRRCILLFEMERLHLPCWLILSLACLHICRGRRDCFLVNVKSVFLYHWDEQWCSQCQLSHVFTLCWYVLGSEKVNYKIF